MKQIVCMKWGTLYDSDYVNKLYGMVRHFTTGDIRFICFTDDTAGIRSEVESILAPKIISSDGIKDGGGWRKLALFRDSKHIFGLKGEFLFLDLDVVITSNIDKLFTYGRKSFVVMPNASQKGQGIGNTSCFRLEVGTHSYLYDNVSADEKGIRAKHNNSQTYISKMINEIAFYPEEWCLLFKVHCVHPLPMRYFMQPRLPKRAKVIAFPGDPNPIEASKGIWKVKVWHKRLYKYIRPAKWISDIYKLCNV